MRLIFKFDRKKKKMHKQLSHAIQTELYTFDCESQLTFAHLTGRLNPKIQLFWMWDYVLVAGKS